MREAYQSHEELSDERPIGRFLKSLETNDQDESVDHPRALGFMREFIHSYGHLLHRTGISAITRARLTQDNELVIPAKNDTVGYQDTIWVELDHRESPSGNERYIWRVSGGKEQYDLELREDYWLATYSEKSEMNMILRRYPIYDEQHIINLQLLIERVVGHKDVHNQMHALIDTIAKEQIELSSLEASGNNLTSLYKNKRIAELRSNLFRAGFQAGSVDRSRSKPLLWL